jgi:lipopolysaccharide transport system ATP-binding protein
MSETAIRVTNLGKKFRIGSKQESYRSLRDALSEAAWRPVRALQSVRRRGNSNGHDQAPNDTIWALKDVSFEVKRGEIIGVIGGNGAGKSTLLKVLSRIMEPSEGHAAIYGRVASLLEVGTGFHPELTGRENIYLNGAILGMRRTEIARNFDEIVAFAEVERFIDTPVKRYSSGMYLRLAFAVSAHLEPENLLVDEVLAVGDASFQKKCLGKMGTVAHQGRTVIFVSHNMVAVQSLCERVLWMRDGRIVEIGPTGRVISNYMQAAFSPLTERMWEDIATAPGNERVRVRSVRVRPLHGSPADPLTVRTPLALEFEYWNLQPGAYLNLSLHVFNEQNIMVFNAVPANEPTWQGHPFPVGLFRDVCFIPADLLNDGTYTIELLVVQDDTVVIYRHEDILMFEVHDTPDMRGAWFGKWAGAVRPSFEWSTELIEKDPSLVAAVPSQAQ